MYQEIEEFERSLHTGNYKLDFCDLTKCVRYDIREME